MTLDTAAEHLRKLQLLEAEWMSREINEQEAVIQRYRGLYITALFLSLGWVVGRLATADAGTRNLADFVFQPDAAVLLCLIPVVNVLFIALLIQATTELESLRRYRRVLGRELAGGDEPWRWDSWLERDRGPFQVWTTFLNVLLGATLGVLTLTPLIVTYPIAKTADSEWLGLLWWLSFALVIGMILIVTVVTLSRLRRPYKSEVTWQELGSHHH